MALLMTWHSFASPATNARGLADNSMNHIANVMTPFWASNSIISDQLKTIQRSREEVSGSLKSRPCMQACKSDVLLNYSETATQRGRLFSQQNDTLDTNTSC